MFSFEFDAPKYKCFGGNEPRRSTLTEIDSTNANDRWFLSFDRPNSWKQLFRKLFDEKQKQEQLQQTKLLQLKQEQNVNQLQNDESKQNQSFKSQLPIKKSFFHNKTNQNLKPGSFKSNDGHKLALKSLDAKHEQENKKKHNSSSILHPQPLKPSKSQPNLQKLKPNEQKRRNPPCLYPIRIQRQWEQAHGKKWYQLTSQQMVQAQKSMKKRLHKTTSLTSRSVRIQHNSQSYHRFTKTKPNSSANFSGNNNRSVQNPFYGMGDRFKK